jgi:hypothetical protein
MEAKMVAEPFGLSMLGGASEARYRRLRPLGVDAPLWRQLAEAELSPDERSAARSGWTVAAMQEYASASSQASMLRALVRAQVPLDLSGMASGFALDELIHAELCARMAQGLGGGAAIIADDSYFPVSPDGPDPLLDAAKLVVWSCCVCESWSKAVLCEMASRTSHPLAHAVWTQIAKDETLHGEFGWIFLDWLSDALEPPERAALNATAGQAVAVLRRGFTALTRVTEAQAAPLGVLPGFAAPELMTFVEMVLEREVISRLRDYGLQASK